MPAVTRIGDADVAHCSGMTRAVGSSDVFANGIAVSRQSDINTAPITTGSTTVKVNGLGCGRIGDAITACTSVAAGSSDVFAGG